MAHLDDDELALLALGERPDERAAAHLATCDRCARELESLAATARVGREAIVGDRLATPEPRVWAAVAAELGMPVERPATEQPARELRRRRLRRGVTAGVAALAAVAAVVVGIVVLVPRPAERTVEATATLRAFPDWPDATGTAALERAPNGERVLHVRLSRVQVADGDAIELWLMNARATRLVSLGDLSCAGGDVTIPRDVDLSRFTTVDVSAEPPDGNPAHSGDSIVRGPLRSSS